MPAEFETRPHLSILDADIGDLSGNDQRLIRCFRAFDPQIMPASGSILIRYGKGRTARRERPPSPTELIRRATGKSVEAALMATPSGTSEPGIRNGPVVPRIPTAMGSPQTTRRLPLKASGPRRRGRTPGFRGQGGEAGTGHPVATAVERRRPCEDTAEQVRRPRAGRAEGEPGATDGTGQGRMDPGGLRVRAGDLHRPGTRLGLGDPRQGRQSACPHDYHDTDLGPCLTRPRLNSKVHHLAPVGVSPSEAATSICCGGSARGVFGAEGEARSGENAPCGARKRTADGPLPSPANAAPPARAGRCRARGVVTPAKTPSGSAGIRPRLLAGPL